MSQAGETSALEPAWLVVEHPDGSREHVRLALSLTTIGRSEGNVLELLDAKLSRFHCEIERRGPGYWLRDCNSRNGTQVNGQEARGPRRLEDGDRVQAGNTVMTFQVGRPSELRRDTAVAILRPSDEEELVTDVGEVEPLTPPMARKRPTSEFDPRRTQPLAGIVPREQASGAWRVLGDAARGLLAARNRAELLERAVHGACHLLQARGALIGQAHALDAEELVVVASEGLDAAGVERCVEVGRRVLTTRTLAFQESRALGVPLGPFTPGQADELGGFQGALVLHDLPRRPLGGSEELNALEVFAALVGRTLMGSLQLEEVRREERQAGARRVAQDLLPWLRPGQLPACPAVDLGLALGQGPEAGSETWDAFLAPEPSASLSGPSAALGAPLWVLWGDVPAPGTVPPVGLRRGGERALFGLAAQAELRGALRALCEVFPGPGEVLQRVHLHARQNEGPARPPLPAALLLLRCDPRTGTLTFAGGGHEPLLLWRARHGGTEVWTAAGPAPCGIEEPALGERELPWERGDVLVLLSAAAARAVPGGASALSDWLGPLAVAEEGAPRLARRLVEELTRAQEGRGADGVAVLAMRRV